MDAFPRRDALKNLTAIGVGALAGEVTQAKPDGPSADFILRENQKQGTRDWMLKNPRIDTATKYRCPWIEGYCSHASVQAGDTISFHVSCNPTSSFTIDLYRLGYYGGTGGRLVESLGPFKGETQIDPPSSPRNRICIGNILSSFRRAMSGCSPDSKPTGNTASVIQQSTKGLSICFDKIQTKGPNSPNWRMEKAAGNNVAINEPMVGI